MIPASKAHIDVNENCELNGQKCTLKNCSACPVALRPVIDKLEVDGSVLPISTPDDRFKNLDIEVFTNPSNTVARIDGEWDIDSRKRLQQCFPYVKNIPTDEEYDIDFTLENCVDRPFAVAIVELLGEPYEVYGLDKYPVVMVYDDCFYIVAPVLTDGEKLD